MHLCTNRTPPEVAQAAGEAAVLVDLQAEVHEDLFAVGDGLAVQAARLVDQLTLEDVVHPGVDGLAGCGHHTLGLGLSLQDLTCLVQQVVQELVCILRGK